LERIQKNILIGFIMLPVLYIVGYAIETTLVFVCKVDDYGYAKNKTIGWIYNSLHQRDGLYDVPNLFFYFIVILISFKLCITIQFIGTISE